MSALSFAWTLLHCIAVWRLISFGQSSWAVLRRVYTYWPRHHIYVIALCTSSGLLCRGAPRFGQQHTPGAPGHLDLPRDDCFPLLVFAAPNLAKATVSCSSAKGSASSYTRGILVIRSRLTGIATPSLLMMTVLSMADSTE